MGKRSDSSDAGVDRRRFLVGAGAVGALGLAGCLGGGDTPTDGDTTVPTGETPANGDTPGETPTEEPVTPTSTPTPRDLNVLVISVTNGHTGHPTGEGIEAVKDIAESIASERGFVVGYSVDVVADHGEYADTTPREFPRTVADLGEYDVIVNNNSNDASPPDSTDTLLFDDEQAAAFESYVRSGGGVAALHAASACQTIDSTYTDILGAYFNEETTAPRIQEMTLAVTDRTHPSTRHLPAEWVVETEMYSWYDDPRGDVHVLASVDETTYDGPASPGNGHRHPVAWCRNVGAGRSWYTQLGHRPERFEDEAFLRHLRGGIEWAAGIADGDASGTVWESYEKTQLVGDTESPSVVTVAPGGDVYYVDRTEYNDVEDSTEELRVIPEGVGESWTAIELPVADRRLPGLRSFVLDPAFEDTRRVYLYYHPPMDEIEEGHFRLSRFEMRSGLRELDPDSEEVILEVPKYEFAVDTERGGHCGGNLAWGPDGEELYLTTGDDTYWDASDFYTPIDEREGRAWNDAQRTSGNTNDFRGSVLRIRPTEDGGYEVPEDNLFTAENGYGEEIEAGLVKPEIHAMGFRNPYRMAVDSETGVPYVADYGPDAPDWDSDRGPQGVTEYTRVDEPGFYGWPYFTGDAVPYREYDFGTGEPGDPFDPEGPTNDSPNNDGLAELPPALGTQLVSPRDWERYLEYPSAWEPHMPYDALGEVPFPQVAGGSPMVATVYRREESHGSGGLSGYFDGKVFVMDRGRGWVKYLTYGEDGDLVDVEPFLPATEFRQPMDMAIGPDGALYVAEWGSGYEGPNDDSGIHRIERTAVDEPSSKSSRASR